MPGHETGLDRFVAAQEGVYDAALAELRAGTKRTHWMWFVFPQLAGLGRSATARLYAIAGSAEACAYLGHPVLGARLVESTQAVLCWAGQREASAIFGPVDAMKLRSSMTLFGRVATDPAAGPFGEVIDAFYGGAEDAETILRLA